MPGVARKRQSRCGANSGRLPVQSRPESPFARARLVASADPRRDAMKKTFFLALVGVCACSVEMPGSLAAGDPVPPFTAVALAGVRAGSPGEAEAQLETTSADGAQSAALGADAASPDLLGAPYLLNVWATWCAPCREEMPELQRLHAAYAPQGFRVVGVSVDDRGAGETIQSFLQEVGVAFPIYHDPSSEIMDAYGLLGLPGSFLVDAEGVLVRKWVGSFHPMSPDVQKSVRALLPSQAADAG